MFSRVAAIALLALPILASANAAPGGGPSQCNTGPIQCCNSVVASKDVRVTQLASLLGINIGPIDALTGFKCSPLNVVGLSSNSCTSQPVCCTGTQFNGLINIGCTPININA